MREFIIIIFIKVYVREILLCMHTVKATNNHKNTVRMMYVVVRKLKKTQQVREREQEKNIYKCDAYEFLWKIQSIFIPTG